jgi:uncharacterized membrane-anchored protein
VYLNKVPQITLVFWSIKMMSTTTGETGADYLIFHLHLGLTLTSLIMGALLVVALLLQFQADRYVPWRYWLAVVLISIFGTLITDNLTDRLHVPLYASTAAFSVLLAATFYIWYSFENTLSIYAINTRRRELFYWAALLVTFALGTAAGDWVSEGMNVGYAPSVVLFGVLIALVAIAHFVFRVNSVLCFWVAYVLTRPLGASCGDLLAKAAKHGGLGLGTTNTSAVFLMVIIALVAYLTVIEKRPSGH